MRRLFIFDYDDTLANFTLYNSLVFRTKQRIIPPIGGLIDGAGEVLKFLHGKGDRLHILTMNIIMDHDSKWRKMDHVGITRWFRKEDIDMVRNKTPEKMLSICGRLPPERCYMVGNSYRHDIEPALGAGINPIYIPRPKYKRIFPGKVDGRVRVLKDIREIIDLYDEL
jgi:phosphoglycolate phosphatase-like HAD superfamily hydrolase